MRYLITGGTGSFGSRYVKRLVDRGDEAVVFSRDELKQWKMRDEVDAEFIIGDVRDRRAIFDACEGIDRVVHTAALKHVATGEAQPYEVILTNLMGTKNVVDACNHHGCEMVLLSTDKAVEPVNTYGASKMLAEKLVLDGGQKVTRWGNVFGSSGSILHIFKQLYAEGHKFRITDERMTRFVITFEEAMDVVDNAFDFEAAAGSIVIPRLDAMRIVDLAYAFDSEAEFETIGMQPGEKLAEKLSADYSSADAPLLTVEEIRELIDGVANTKEPEHKKQLHRQWSELTENERYEMISPNGRRIPRR